MLNYVAPEKLLLIPHVVRVGQYIRILLYVFVQRRNETSHFSPEFLELSLESNN